MVDIKILNARLTTLTDRDFVVRVNVPRIMIEDPDGRSYEGNVEGAMQLIDIAEAGYKPMPAKRRSPKCVVRTA